MAEDDRGMVPAEDLRGLQILVGAFTAGVVLFAIVALFVPMFAELKELEGPMTEVALFIALAGLGVMSALMWPFIRSAQSKTARAAIARAADASALRRAIGEGLRIRVMVGAALVEGFGLFGTVVYLLTRQPLALVAPALSAVFLLATFPSRERLERIARELTSSGERPLLD